MRPVSPPASDIPINCITLLFRLHLFGNLTSKSAQSRPMLHAHVTGGLCKCSVFTEYSCEFSFTQVARWARWLRGQEPAKWAAAGRDRKPGVKDILRAEITPRCWEHEQPVRVSFTKPMEAAASATCCRTSVGKNSNNFSTVIISSTHHRSCQCCGRWTSWTPDLQRQGTSCGRGAACSREADIWQNELRLQQHIGPSNMTLLKGSFNNCATASLGR